MALEVCRYKRLIFCISRSCDDLESRHETASSSYATFTVLFNGGKVVGH